MENLDTDGIIQSYFNKKNIIVDHQISSYNYFIESILPQIISHYFPVIVKFNDENCAIKSVSLNAINVRIGKPMLIENNGCSKYFMHSLPL